jgi:hypothetical protein
MHTPSAALAWELWCRHRRRLFVMAGVLLGFAIVYPVLCSMDGFNLNSPNVLEDIAHKFEKSGSEPISLPRIVGVLCALFLACGPAAAMFLTLLYVTWMFTNVALKVHTRDPMTFPERLFTLPLSTPFLFWWFFLAGQGTILVLYSAWVHFVRLPHLDIFSTYQNCFAWMTLVALAQGIVWALAAWPISRALALAAVLYCFALSPARRDLIEFPLMLPPIFLLGLVLGRIGLQKMRHGQWQGLAWKRPFAAMAAQAELRGPKRFSSPTQAQLWFEWRRLASPLCLYVASLIFAPLFILLIARIGFGLAPLQHNTMNVLAGYLVAMPLIIHFLSAFSPSKNDQLFLMIRPMTNGEMTMAALKAAGISSVFSWVMALAGFCALPLLGNFHAVESDSFPPPAYWTITVLGLMFLAWRMIAVNLCFAWSGKRRLTELPAFMLIVVYLGAFAFAILRQHVGYWASFLRMVPVLLACLVAVKFLLAFLAFRVCLQRRLLAPSALAGYLIVWLLLAAIMLTQAAFLFHSSPWFLPLSMGIVLLTPLARIGFCPITLAWNRQTRN